MSCLAAISVSCTSILVFVVEAALSGMIALNFLSMELKLNKHNYLHKPYQIKHPLPTFEPNH
jgi:hypothetical protein